MIQPKDYSEEAQEDVYLSQEAVYPAYSETLQEDVYLGKAKPPTAQQRGRAECRQARKLPSRTPSPPTAAEFVDELLSEAATTAASWLSIAAETIAASIPEIEVESAASQRVPVKR